MAFDKDLRTIQEVRDLIAASKAAQKLYAKFSQARLREIAAADARFELASFVEGARGAYRMILEAFWTGDKETLRDLWRAARRPSR